VLVVQRKREQREEKEGAQQPDEDPHVGAILGGAHQEKRARWKAGPSGQ
jgi:hypothetical protein